MEESPSLSQPWVTHSPTWCLTQLRPWIYCCMGTRVYSFTQGLVDNFFLNWDYWFILQRSNGIVCISHPAMCATVIFVPHGQLFWDWSLVFSDWSRELNRNFGVPYPISDHLFGTETLDNTISTFSTVQPKNRAPSLFTSTHLLIPIYLIYCGSGVVILGLVSCYFISITLVSWNSNLWNGNKSYPS